MFFNFPPVKTTRTIVEQAQKILDEVEEFKAELDDREAIDVLHAVETFLRLHFKGRESVIDKLIREVKEKNEKRGYYDNSCY